MSEYTVKYINRRARIDAAGFIRDCEEHYHRQIHMAADEIVRNREHCPIVLGQDYDERPDRTHRRAGRRAREHALDG